MTTLKCGDYRCRQTNVVAFIDTRNFTQKEKGEAPEVTLRDLRCKMHTAAKRRSRYQSDRMLDLTDEQRAEMLKLQAVEDQRVAEQRAKSEVETQARAVKRRAEAWAAMDEPAQHALVPDDDRPLFAEEPTFEGRVWTGEKPDRFDSRWFNLEPMQRFYGKTETPYPYGIRVTRGSTLTPNEARALAAAIVEAADKAEELNAKRKPA